MQCETQIGSIEVEIHSLISRLLGKDMRRRHIHTANLGAPKSRLQY
jgi:hypothetical protein